MPASNPSRHTLADLLDIMARLRAPGGCPWDIKQTHESILSCLIEETYEFVDAVENRDVPNMREELGDLLLQVVFHAQMAREKGDFTFEDVVQTLSEKLIRRHPHVFGEVRVDSAEAVQKQWDDLKSLEKEAKEKDGGEDPESGLGIIPRHLPALLKAEKLQKRAARTGFDWPDYHGPKEKIREELAELMAEAEGGDGLRLEEEFGDLLFAVVNLGRFFHLDPEKSLARANQKFKLRYENMEKLARTEGRETKRLSLEEWDGYWERNKAEEKEKGDRGQGEGIRENKTEE